MKWLPAVLIAATLVFSQEDIRAHRRCTQCNMDRKAYGFSRMLLHFGDGSGAGVCSINCAVAELEADTARKVKSMEVADRNTRLLIDAERAFWVIGGDKPGVMSKTAKWAFADKSDAEKFVSGHGGRLASFKEALDAAKIHSINKRRVR